MATHSSILAWRILWTEEPGGLWSTGSQRVRHDWSDLASMDSFHLGRWKIQEMDERCTTMSMFLVPLNRTNMFKIVCFVLCGFYHNKRKNVLKNVSSSYIFILLVGVIIWREYKFQWWQYSVVLRYERKHSKFILSSSMLITQ